MVTATVARTASAAAAPTAVATANAPTNEGSKAAGAGHTPAVPYFKGSTLQTRGGIYYCSSGSYINNLDLGGAKLGKLGKGELGCTSHCSIISSLQDMGPADRIEPRRGQVHHRVLSKALVSDTSLRCLRLVVAH